MIVITVIVITVIVITEFDCLFESWIHTFLFLRYLGFCLLMNKWWTKLFPVLMHFFFRFCSANRSKKKLDLSFFFFNLKINSPLFWNTSNLNNFSNFDMRLLKWYIWMEENFLQQTKKSNIPCSFYKIFFTLFPRNKTFIINEDHATSSVVTFMPI